MARRITKFTQLFFFYQIFMMPLNCMMRRSKSEVSLLNLEVSEKEDPFKQKVLIKDSKQEIVSPTPVKSISCENMIFGFEKDLIKNPVIKTLDPYEKMPALVRSASEPAKNVSEKIPGSISQL